MSILYAKIQLAEWGRWSREVPALRSNWRTWFSGGRQASIEMPDHIQQVDAAVCRCESMPRIVLIIHYCQQGTIREKAQRLEIPKSTYVSRLEAGQWCVNIELENIDLPRTKEHARNYRDQTVTATR